MSSALPGPSARRAPARLGAGLLTGLLTGLLALVLLPACSLHAATPTVLSVTVPLDGVYSFGDDLGFLVNVSENVLVDTNAGFPRIALDIGGSNRFAHFAGGSGSNVLTFLYPVATTDRDADGIGLGATLEFNGGTILNLGSEALDPALANPGVTTGVVVNGSAPTGTDDTFTLGEDSVLTGFNVLTNDVDLNGDILTALLVTGPTHGVLTLSSNGTFTYTPATNFNGQDSFGYRADDGWYQSAPVTVSLTVSPVNDGPTVLVAIPDQAATYGTLFSASVAGVFTDLDGDVVTNTVTGLPSGLFLDRTNNVITGRPATSGSFSVSLVAHDSGGLDLTATNTFQLLVDKALLVVTATNGVRGFGVANPALTLGYSGFLGTDTAVVLTNRPVASTAATNRSVAGTYPITLAGGADHRYAFAFSNGFLTVTQLVLVVRAENKVKELGAANPALTLAYAGFAAGDSPSVLAALPTVATTALVNSPEGDYPISLSGGAADNYVLVLVGGTLTVRPAGVPRARGRIS